MISSPQATGQYLANINIWAGNICALLRRKTPWCGSQVRCSDSISNSLIRSSYRLLCVGGF